MSYDQNQQQYGYDDGRTKMSYSSSNVSYRSGGTPGPAQSPSGMPQIQLPQMPMLDHNAFHQQALANHQNLHNHMMQSMGMMNIGAQQPQTGFSPQTQYQQQQLMPPGHEAPPVQRPQTLLTGYAEEESSSGEEESDSDDHESSSHHRQLEAENHHLREKHQLENAHLKSQLEAERRHNKQLSEAYAAASTPGQTPAFDTAALTRTVEDIIKRNLKSSGPSREEMASLIQQACARQMEGLAKKSDIQAAAVKMEEDLNRRPRVASHTDVQMAVQTGIQEVMEKAMRKQQKEQRRLEAPRADDGPANWQRQQAELPVEEIEEPMMSVSKWKSRKSKSVAPNSDHDEPYQPLNSQNLAQLSQPASRSSRPVKSSVAPGDYYAVVEAKSSKSKSSRSSVAPDPYGASPAPEAQQMMLPDSPSQALTSDALARLSGHNSKSSKSSTTKSVAPGDHNALMRPRSSKSPKSVAPDDHNAMGTSPLDVPQRYSSGADAIAAMQAQKHGAPQTLYAENLAMLSGSDKKSGKSTVQSVAPGANNALGRPKSSKSSARSRVPDDDNALVKPSSRSGGKAKSSTKSVAASDSNAMVRSASGEGRKHLSAADAMADRQASVSVVEEEDGPGQLVRQRGDIARRH